MNPSQSGWSVNIFPYRYQRLGVPTIDHHPPHPTKAQATFFFKWERGKKKALTTFLLLTNPNPHHTRQKKPKAFFDKMASVATVTLPLPVLPEGWSAEKDFKAVGHLTGATERSIEPVGPHFLAHARRARHKRTFSEDDRIQAQEKAKNVEDADDGEISEAEDPMLLQREAKDWKVRSSLSLSSLFHNPMGKEEHLGKGKQLLDGNTDTDREAPQ